MTEVVVDVAIGTAIIAVTAWHWYTRGRSDEQWRCPRCGGLHSYRATGCPVPRAVTCIICRHL